MAPLEPWEKVLVDAEAFLNTTHGQIECGACHFGQNSEDKDTSHTGLVADPSLDVEQMCGACHTGEAAHYPDSLHATLAGYWTKLEARSVPENHAALETMFGNHCAGCHTSCGECHVSQPQNVGGGLFNGHVFERTPPMTRSCTACHGSRVGSEYLGKHEEIPGDVHFREGRMNCVACHEGKDLHSAPVRVATEDQHRYAGAQLPGCQSCHTGVVSDQNAMHQQHSQNLSCQVCHSVTYTSCDGCHVAISETSGNPYFETEATYLTFFIGRNPLQSEERPYEYVPVRHIPAAVNGYAYYGEDLLPNFNALPTWVYATPHNIQLHTPQNASCEACHGNPDLFLTADKVDPAELEANQSVIVAAPAPSLDAILNAPALPADHDGRTTCLACHKTGSGGAKLVPEDHTGRDDSGCTSCHRPQD